MSNGIEYDDPRSGTSPSERVEMLVGSTSGLQGHVTWEDPRLGRCIVTLLRDGETVWSTIDLASNWPMLSALLRGLATALPEVMGWPDCERSGVGIAFAQGAPHGLPALRFERVGREIDVVTTGCRIRWHFGDSVRTLRFVGEEIAAKGMTHGAFDDELLALWAPHVPGDFYAVDH